MRYERDVFCSSCGTAFANKEKYPRVCGACGFQVWANPIPVSVVIVPVLEGERTGLLVVRRGIEPGKGRLAFAGGFLEEHETWQQGGARELLEEVNVTVDATTLEPFWYTSTEPRPNRVLLFSLAKPILITELGVFEVNEEAPERGLVFGPEGLDELFAFGLHVAAARRFFRIRGISGPAAYVAC